MEKKSCLFYGEGRKDRKFLSKLAGLDKFGYHTKDAWVFPFQTGSWHGDSPKDILIGCKNEQKDGQYALCFIDIDKLQHDFPVSWKDEKIQLEAEAENSKVKIIWQSKDLEDEIIRVLSGGSESKARRLRRKSKHDLNKLATENIELFVNSNYWNTLLKGLEELESFK